MIPVDVANCANVTTATVCKVLRNRGNVGPYTVERVFGWIKDRSYNLDFNACDRTFSSVRWRPNSGFSFARSISTAAGSADRPPARY
ncbi:LacI family DNA-binding transcriptional regulator [Paraburkholderia sp.]|uniref:LacI family DNA-binding transcriptional regulator n=1 Tax=Paraburkholderia sp. TaxID=1926495 RepID=UPI003C7BC86A